MNTSRQYLFSCSATTRTISILILNIFFFLPGFVFIRRSDIRKHQKDSVDGSRLSSHSLRFLSTDTKFFFAFSFYFFWISMERLNASGRPLNVRLLNNYREREKKETQQTSRIIYSYFLIVKTEEHKKMWDEMRRCEGSLVCRRNPLIWMYAYKLISKMLTDDAIFECFYNKTLFFLLHSNSCRLVSVRGKKKLIAKST